MKPGPMFHAGARSLSGHEYRLPKYLETRVDGRGAGDTRHGGAVFGRRGMEAAPEVAVATGPSK